MDDVRRLVAAMCDIEHRGGRCVHRDAHTMVVYDVHKWSDDMTQLLKQHFPYCVVDVCASNSSLSGFVVCVTHRERSLATTACALVCAMVCSSFVLAQYIAQRFGDHH